MVPQSPKLSVFWRIMPTLAVAAALALLAGAAVLGWYSTGPTAWKRPPR